VVVGARVPLTVGALSVAGAMLLGTIGGLFAGFYLAKIVGIGETDAPPRITRPADTDSANERMMTIRMD
jgi:hypothetical protein